ncbi:hypothetical protein [Streptomyces olivochromogenes]|uniref:hypothetical protein n=1 Tax=Streptomyces olivochromogenes TaxID=1963 RepID=UPI001F190B0B|nr:hypothetical protein [Streptomyces olivochromogenes]
MSMSDESITCPFDYSEALDFDPELAAIMERDSLTRIRLPYGDAGAWLVTGFRSVQRSLPTSASAGRRSWAATIPG